MASERGMAATRPRWRREDAASAGKEPRTERGRRTLRAILDAAAAEFGEKGFHEGSISGITRRAGVALGSFYTYFDSKDAVFRALVRDMSEQVREHVGPAIRAAPDQIAAERAACSQLHRLRARAQGNLPDHRRSRVRRSRELPHALRDHRRTHRRAPASAAAERGEVRGDVSEVHAWAIMGMNVFLGLRYGVWDEDRDAEAIADTVAEMLARGLAK